MEPGVLNSLDGHDLWQWVGGGWFWYTGEEPRVPAQLYQVNDDEWEIQTLSSKYIAMTAATKALCVPVWPRCGALNIPEYRCAIVLEREQQRQYRRTYNSRCLTVHIPRKWDAVKNVDDAKHASANDPRVVAAAFNPTYPSYAEALALLDGRLHVSVALNPHLLIAGPVQEQLVYYRSKLVGTIVKRKLRHFDDSPDRLRRLLKWFDGRVTL